ncbi:hypothetical protein J3R83DRAFT_12842 [Lanmaoa asiatica]|nr:hypothetical protein J3R83DRAFT_12842 [Lanmaoa asiatica]
MSRTAHRLFSSSLRFPARTNLNAAACSSRAALTRRMMNSESHASHGGSTSNDTPWIIGSALVFGPLVSTLDARLLFPDPPVIQFLYLVSPSARKGSHGHTDHGHKSHRQHVESHQDVAPITDDEGTEVSGQEVKESIEKAFEADSPKEAQEQEEVVAKAEKTQSQAASLADATPVLESGLNPTPSALVRVDEVTHTASDEKIQSTARTE